MRSKLFIASIIILLLFGCGRWGGGGDLYTHSYLVKDTLQPINLSIYARVPKGYKESTLPLLFTAISPEGVSYQESLELPLTVSGVEAAKLECGLWRDFQWCYRRAVTLPKEGVWHFYLESTLSVRLPKNGIGFIVTEEEKKSSNYL